jgi:hypothetical protein
MAALTALASARLMVRLDMGPSPENLMWPIAAHTREFGPDPGDVTKISAFV